MTHCHPINSGKILKSREAWNPFISIKPVKKRTIYEADLNLDRTNRIYETLNKLSNDSVQFLKSGDLKEFSFATDRMRPLMAYINDNKVLISKHLEDSGGTEKKYKQAIQEFASNLYRT